MNVLIIGSGGREHVLCWKIKQSPLLDALYALPGSSAISEIADCSNIAMDDFEGIFKFCAYIDQGISFNAVVAHHLLKNLFHIFTTFT